MTKLKDTHRLFITIWATPDRVVVHGNERLQAMDLESHGLIRMTGGGGKNYAKCTANGRRIGDALFEIKEG